MTKSELDTILEKKHFLCKNDVWFNHKTDYTITVYGEHLITITILTPYSSISRYILIEDLSVKKLEKIIKKMIEKLKELNKEL